jgi:phospholipase/carboxylesterase
MTLQLQKLDGPRQGPEPGQARQLVVLLHGLGADGRDLIGLAPVLGEILPDAAFVSPHAPEPCDLAPFGYQWFSLREVTPQALLAGVEAAAPVLQAFLDQELERYGLEDRQMALLGFSQGGMMALYVAPRRAQPCAGVLSYSGALVGGEDLLRGARSRPPILLVHGDADPVVPFQALGAAKAGLEAAGFSVLAEARPGLAHGIDNEGLSLGAAFLSKVLEGDTTPE